MKKFFGYVVFCIVVIAAVNIVALFYGWPVEKVILLVLLGKECQREYFKKEES